MNLPSLDLDAELWLRVDAAVVRLKPKGEAEVPEIIIVSDAVDRHFSLTWMAESRHEEQKDKHYREWKRVNRSPHKTEMRKEEKRLRCALLRWFSVEHRDEVR